MATSSGGAGWMFLISTTLCCLLHLCHGKLFPYGVDNGDDELFYDSSAIATQRIDLFFPTPFLGPGLISELHISSSGTLSYAKLQNANLEWLTNNVVVAPFMAEMGTGGRVFYRQTENDIQVLSMVTSLLGAQGVTFTPILAVVVTWVDMPSPDDPSKTNTFQAVFTSSGSKTFVIFNYKDSISWTSSTLAERSYAGIFAAGDLLERCGQPLKNSGTDQIWTVAEQSTRSSVKGQHILDLTRTMECFSFESPCGEPPKLGRTKATPMFENSQENILGWSFFVELECKQGLEISPGVKTQRIQCLYEPDYYEYAWDFEIKECVDLRATKKFQVSISNILIDVMAGNSIEVIKNKLIPEINKLLARAGITDVVIQIDSLTKTLKVTSGFREGNAEPEEDYEVPFAPAGMMADPVMLADEPADDAFNSWNVEFTIFSPTYANKELTPFSLKESLMTLLSTGSDLLSSGTVNVEDLTDKCLQECICFIREKSGKNCAKGTRSMPLRPDACCGGCNGKAYASSKKVCCNGRNLYDPSRSVCCPDGRIRIGTKCPS